MRRNVNAPNEGIARERRRRKLAKEIDHGRLYEFDYRREGVLRDAFAAGVTMREVAWAFSTSKGTILRWKRHHGLSASNGQDVDAAAAEG